MSRGQRNETLQQNQVKIAPSIRKFWADAKIVTAVLLVLLVALFAAQNTDPVELDFVIWSFAVSEALVVFLAMFSGMVAGVVLRGWFRRKLQRG